MRVAGGVVQASQRPIPFCLRGGWRRLQQQVAVGLGAQGGGGEELLGPRQVTTLLTGEHGRDKPGGSHAIGANCGRSASSRVSSCLPRCFLLPGLRLSRRCSSARRSRSSNRRSSQSVRRLATSAAAPRNGGTVGASKSFERHSSNCEHSSLPVPCTASRRQRQPCASDSSRECGAR